MLKHLRIFFVVYVCFLLLPISSFAQEQPDKKYAQVKSIRDIPHRTLWQKWMWPHRSAAYIVTKERPVDYDTAYVKSYRKRFVATLPVSTRFLKFSLRDRESGSRLVFAPNLQYNLGISISSRWASFILNTGVKVYGGATGQKGTTKYQDYQMNIYGRKFTTDMFVQYYSGFYIRNSKTYDNYNSDTLFALRPDVHALHMGVSSYYIVNNKKFSYRSSFSFVEQQKKSTGSMLAGVYYSYFDAGSDVSLVSDPFRENFDTLSLIRSGRTQDFGINLGYIYTFVFRKKFSATASLVQGIGAEHLHYSRDDRSTHNQLIWGAGKLHVRAGLKYDNDRFFIGTMGIFDYFLLRKKSDSTFDYSYGKAMIYVGYRFSTIKQEHRILKKLKLVDY